MEKIDNARLIANGYEPVAVSGKRPVADEWQKRPNTPEAIAAERTAHPHALSTGLRTGRLAAIDIDTPRVSGAPAGYSGPWEHTADIEALASEVLGPTLLRRVGAKGALLCHQNKAPVPKITIKGEHATLHQRDPKSPNASVPLTAKVEILGVGQQFVAYGVHPDIGRPYEWTNAALDGEPVAMPLADLPEVTPDRLREFARRTAALLTELGYQNVSVSDPGDPERRAVREAKRRADRIPVPEAELIEILGRILPDCDRNRWIGYVGAIQATNLRGVSEDDMDARLCEIAQAWSRGDYGSAPANWISDDDVEHTYYTLDPERQGGTTFGTLYYAARENGYDKPAPQPLVSELFDPADVIAAAAAAVEAAADPLTPARRRTVQLQNGAGTKPVKIEWVWPGYLARGKFHILGGGKGVGKSTMVFDWFARLSTGGTWPDGAAAPRGDVLVWSSEDDFADTILPRFLAAGGDPDRLNFVRGVADANGVTQPFDPAYDTPELIDAARRLPNLVAIMVDPVVSAVAGDSHKNAETRRGLQPLVDLAAESGAALIGITHFTKNTQGREPIERITGSLAFGALARIVLGAARGPDNSSPRRLVRIASNIGGDGGGFEYTLHQGQLAGYDFEAQRVIWGKHLTGSARDLLDEGQWQPGEKLRAIDFLKAQLIEAGEGGVPVAGLKRAAAAHSLNWRTVERAKTELGCIHAFQRPGAVHGGWCWVWGAVPPAAAAGLRVVHCIFRGKSAGDSGMKSAT